MSGKSFVLKGDICYSEDRKTLHCEENAYAVCVDGVSRGVFETLPEEYRTLPLTDCSGKLVIPGLSDLHIHAAQFAYRGMYMDVELLDWLKLHAFPEESKFADTAYAEKAYSLFADAMKKSVTTRFCAFASAHTDATEILMEKVAAVGLGAYIGRVNMDMDAPDSLREPDADFSARETLRWLDDTQGKYERVFPIVTPRFVLSCTRPLMEKLSDIVKERKVPVQSHLSENLGEIAAVSELFPEFPTYGEVYDHYNMFGGVSKTIMAHCVYSSPREVDLMEKNGVFIVHCPASNTNVITGIAPVRAYFDRGMNMGLGSDVAGGHTESMFRAVVDTVQISKRYWRHIDQGAKPLTFPEAFYLATVGGGAYFGKVGSFAEGYEFDAVVLDDACLPHPQSLSAAERLERAVYLSLDERGGVVGKYVAGEKLAL